MSRSFGHIVRKAGILTGLLLAQVLVPVSSAALNADSQELFKQGQRYERNSHSSQDYRRAYWAYCLAARHGHAEAAYNIAWMYLNGRGLPRDDELAGHWLDLSARLGDPHSIHLADRLLLDIADDDPNCPRALGRKDLDVHQFSQRLARFGDTGDSPFDLRPVSRPPPPDEQQRLAILEKQQTAEPALPPVEDRSPTSDQRSDPAQSKRSTKLSSTGPLALTDKPTAPGPTQKSTPKSAIISATDNKSAIAKQADTPKPGPTLPINPPPVSSQKTSTQTQVAADTRERSAASPPPLNCPWTLAARHDGYRERVIKWLESQGISYQINNDRDRVSDYYVVMIPPLGDQAAASSTVSTLKTKGYRHFRVFDSGDYRNAVSLGIFRNEAGAISLVSKLKNQGFQAVHKRMNFPPIIPLITTTLSNEQSRALQTEFPPLPMKQLDCDKPQDQVLTRNS
ncbi:MAG: hypothetical protein ACPG4N_02665 [Gammaproteobacteria bacterium]